MLASLSHPNIIGYHEAFISKGILHIVLDYADGGDLGQKIKALKRSRAGSRKVSYGFPEQQVLHWFTQILCALAYL